MFSSLRAKIIAISCLIVVGAMAVLSATNIWRVRSDTIAALNANMEQLADSHVSKIAEWVHSKRTITSAMKQAIKLQEPMPSLYQAKDAGEFANAFIGFSDKRIWMLTTPKPGYDPTSRPWYKQAISAGGPVLTPPYADNGTGALVVTFAEPVSLEGEQKAVLGTDVRLDTVVNNVAAIKPTPNSFAFVVDKNGVIVTHPQKDLALKPLSALEPSLTIDTLQNVGRGGGMILDGVNYMFYVRPIQGTDWSLVIALNYLEATSPVRSLVLTSTIVALLAIGFAAILLMLAISAMLRRLSLVRDAMEDISSGEGDLTRRIDTRGNDELAQISTAFNRFVEKISDTMRQIRMASESVKTSAGEITTGNLDLSGRTEEQAGSLEETASAMEELTSTVKQNAENARQANQFAVSASEVAAEGGTVVSQVVETMRSINASAKKIAEIISVIDGIAFQTNILALNAAVEAARAGDQGRGFAVVASEVRSLAQRSATAAKEIKMLIDASVSEVEVGNILVEKAGYTMKEVVSSVRRVTDIVAEISAASQQQSAGIGEIGHAITMMDQVTQQNAALVEQAAAAAQSLQDQATSLATTVAGFKLLEYGSERYIRSSMDTRSDETVSLKIQTRLVPTKRRIGQPSMVAESVSNPERMDPMKTSSWADL